MTFKELFLDKKPVIGMIHTGSNAEISMLDLAKKEVGIYLKYGVVPLIENYFGSDKDCSAVLQWMHEVHPDAIYGVNILGDSQLAFELAHKYGAKFIQVDSVCGHLKPKHEPDYVEKLNKNRTEYNVAVLGGVRFKYQSVKSGRSTEEDLRLGTERCDAIVCTGTGTGIETPLDKVDQFKATVGNFPVIVGAGVTLETVQTTMSRCDGMIVGSWFKYEHQAHNVVCEENVRDFMEAISMDNPR
ncbi:MAG: BtpA/SgcQ family protein [Alloprevotella sp.]|nr:BtpA/SgcQ family protein [Alloprevotella sp.]